MISLGIERHGIRKFHSGAKAQVWRPFLFLLGCSMHVDRMTGLYMSTNFVKHNMAKYRTVSQSIFIYIYIVSILYHAEWRTLCTCVSLGKSTTWAKGDMCSKSDMTKLCLHLCCQADLLRTQLHPVRWAADRRKIHWLRQREGSCNRPHQGCPERMMLKRLDTQILYTECPRKFWPHKPASP